MVYLAATRNTQGKRKNDFCNCEEGDFVNFHFECDGESVDGQCGCRRSLSAIGGGATTTMKVVEITEAQKNDIIASIEKHLMVSWGCGGDEAAKIAADDFAEISRIAGSFSLGAVVEKRGRNIWGRVQ